MMLENGFYRRPRSRQRRLKPLPYPLASLPRRRLRSRKQFNRPRTRRAAAWPDRFKMPYSPKMPLEVRLKKHCQASKRYREKNPDKFSESNKRNSKAQFAKINAELRRHATSEFQRYNPDEDKQILHRTGTIREIALKLGRSYSSILHRILRLRNGELMG